jgi:hypothetical protein
MRALQQCDVNCSTLYLRAGVDEWPPASIPSAQRHHTEQLTAILQCPCAQHVVIPLREKTWLSISAFTRQRELESI